MRLMRGALNAEGQMLSFNRKIQFSSGYRLSDPTLSPEENERLYGSDHCKNLGSTFELEAHFIREGLPAIDPLTGMIVNLVEVDKWLLDIRELLTSRMLNDLTAPLVPTLEAVATLIGDKLEDRITKDHELSSAAAVSNSSARTRSANASFIVRLHKLKLSIAGAPGSVVSQESVTLDL